MGCKGSMGCQDSSTYGEGTPCSPSKPCRPPLVCEDGRCALPQGGAAGAPSTAGNSNAGGDNHSDTANGGMGGDGDANARTDGASDGTNGAGSGPASGGAAGGSPEPGGADGGASGSKTNGDAGGTAGKGGAVNRGGTDTTGGSASAGSAGVGHAGGAGHTGGASAAGGATSTGGAAATGGGEDAGGAAGSAGTAGAGGAAGSAGTAGTAGRLTAVWVADGSTHICAVTKDAKAVCWGSNLCNQLGDGESADTCTAGQYSDEPVEPVGVSEVEAVAVGFYFTCALLTGGEVWCWGTGTKGQLGNETGTRSANAPVQVDLDRKATAITTGWEHGCALLEDATVACWGLNHSLALGNGNNDPTTVAWTPEPVLTSGESSVDPLGQVSAISSKMYHTCAVLKDRKVMCWGEGSLGQLGNHDPPYADSSLAVPVEGVEAEAVAVGDSHSCALDAAGAIVCWGEGSSGELGDGQAQDSLLPVTVLLPGAEHATALACGLYHSCAILGNAEQTAVCWGYNDNGQVGAGISQAQFDTPVPVAGLSHLTAISADRDDTCAVVATQDNPGAVYCWGNDGWDKKGPPVLVQGF